MALVAITCTSSGVEAVGAAEPLEDHQSLQSSFHGLIGGGGSLAPIPSPIRTAS